MRKYKVVVLVVLFVVLQFGFSYMSADRFMNHMRENIGLMERQMAERGVPPNQSGHMAATLGSMSLTVSSYVRSETHTSIIMNAALLVILFYGWRREGSPSQGEA